MTEVKETSLDENGPTQSNGTVEEKVETACQAFHAILKNIGDNGKYQFRLMIITGFCGIFTSFHNLGATFLGATPDHWCNIPSLDVNATASRDFQNYTVPWVKDKEGNPKHSSCRFYTHNYSDIDVIESYVNNTSVPEESCRSWYYGDKVHGSTVVTEWDLVCKRRWLMSSIQASYMMGILAGAVIFSPISDRIGRKISAMICTLLFIVSSIIASFSANFEMFLIFRFITAAAGQGLFLINFVILMEVCGRRARAIHGNLFHIPFSIGFSLLPLFAYYFRDWRDLQLSISIPTITLLLQFWLLPESPRWLLMQTRFDEGEKILRAIAKCNGASMPNDADLKNYFNVITKEVQREPTKSIKERLKHSLEDMISLVRTPNMRRRNLITFYNWFVVSMMYYGLTFNSSNINASIYVAVLLAGLVEFPGTAATIYVTLKCGRRIALASVMILSGVACVAVVFVPSNLSWINLTLTSFGKMMITGGFLLVFMFSAELVPTNVRNTSLGMASMCARIGSGIAPYIVDLLGDVYYSIPSTIFGILAILSGLLTFLLPETGTMSLPESIDDVERLAR